MVQQSFLHYRVFSHAKSLPWTLCQGDIAAHLEALALEPECPQEEVSAKVYKLLKLNYNFHLVVDAVSLLRQVHWATTHVEQGHGSMASISKYHP